MNDINGDDLVRRLALRIADLEVANAMLSQQVDTLKRQLTAASAADAVAEAPDGNR